MSIQVRNISHIYSEGLPHESVALHNISFDINDGEFVGIIGHTGSGKSTLLQHLNGLLKPKSGQIVVGGVDITAGKVSMIEVRRRTGLVFQYPEYQLFEETIAKDVAFGPTNLGLSPEEIDARVEEALTLVGLSYEEFKDKSPFDLSGGEKRKVAIAGVIAMKPEVLILDEPTAGLDPKAHRDILNMIENIHDHEKNITILVTHKMDDVARLADKVLVMEEGKLVLNGTPEEIFSQKETLQSMGLSIPEATELIGELADKGFTLPKNVLTMDQAEDAIVAALKDRNNNLC
jgi:energy-coupling factor transport system ATP-binding protein